MPMIQLTTNVTVSDSAKAKLAAGLGKAISLLPGKNEGQLMLSISGENYMAFQGRDDRSVAYVSTGIAGKTDAESCKKIRRIGHPAARRSPSDSEGEYLPDPSGDSLLGRLR